MSRNSDDLEVEAGGSARGLLILGLLGGLLIGGGLAYYFLKDQITSGDNGENSQQEEEENSEPFQAVRFERLTVPIYARSGNASRYIGNFFINIDVLVQGDENLIAVRRSEPQLQHAFISAISSANLMQEDSGFRCRGGCLCRRSAQESKLTVDRCDREVTGDIEQLFMSDRRMRACMHRFCFLEYRCG